MPIPQYSGDWPPKENLVSLPLVVKDGNQMENEELGGSARSDGNEKECPEPSVINDLASNASKPVKGAQCTDRTELMLRIKRGESPQWVPNENLQREYLKENQSPTKTSVPAGRRTQSANHIYSEAKMEYPEELASPTEIERPPSALHSGDFKQISPNQSGENLGLPVDSPFQLHGIESTLRYSKDHRLSEHEDVAPWALKKTQKPPSPDRRRSATLSYSNYVFKKPTTPLIQQSTNTDLDQTARERSISPEQGNRRHTLPPRRLRDWDYQLHNGLSTTDRSSQSNDVKPSSTSYQSARRSITFPWSLQASSPPTPGFLRSRRTSFSSEASPRQHASMVGSYEESILHGRMSTAPSKPFEFQANIGVLGRGKKPKMPPHITVPFHAVFYDWSAKTQLPSICDEPSPYVGEIDLRKSGPMPSVSRMRPAEEKVSLSTQESPTIQLEGKSCQFNQSPAGKRRRLFPPPEGSYRIPERGQIQVVIKNPYKTALKLFLVPYDLTGIQPGQKTFVRQRYYSKGPIIERPVTLGAETTPSNAQSRPILRYLIHLKMCCSSKGYFYLYSNIRVVFANRVPDDKEYLTKELQQPNPKYSPWKPYSHSSRNFTPPSRMTADQTFRRRSLGGNPNFVTDINPTRTYKTLDPHTDTSVPPIPPIPPVLLEPSPFPPSHDKGGSFHRSQLGTPWSEVNEWGSMGESQLNWNQGIQNEGQNDGYVKLQKGESGYGGSRSGTPQPGEGLLTRRLRGVEDSRDFSPHASSA